MATKAKSWKDWTERLENVLLETQCMRKGKTSVATAERTISKLAIFLVHHLKSLKIQVGD